MSNSSAHINAAVAKVRRQAKVALLRGGGISRFFSAMKNRPTDDQFADMVVASTLGPGDTLAAGGPAFAWEFIVDEVNRAVEMLREQERLGDLAAPVDDLQGMLRTTSETWGNLVFRVRVASRLLPFLPQLSADDFELAPEMCGVIDRDSRAFGILVAHEPMVPFKDIFLEDEQGYPAVWVPTPLKSNKHATIYWVAVMPLDMIENLVAKLNESREKHDVEGHERHLSSGKVVFVRAHDRRNPLRGKHSRANLSAVRHVVYRAFDSDGVLRYIGEGREGRPDHVNSGASHNVEINRHFFTRGEMRVETIATGLTKLESLAVEKLLLRSHNGPELWNRRDYEPDVDRGSAREVSGAPEVPN